jgi:hypothetical protein
LAVFSLVKADLGVDLNSMLIICYLLVDEMGCEIEEAGFHIGADFGARQKNADACLLGEPVHVVLSDLWVLSTGCALFFDSVRLVADNDDGDVIIGMLLDFL